MRVEIVLGGATLSFARAGSADAFPWLTSVGTVRMAARAGGYGVTESSSLEVAIDNAGRQAARILDAPLRRLARVYDDDGRLFFRGTVQKAEVGRELRLTIESGGERLLLSEALPLRTTRTLGDYAEDAVLPERFGDLTAARFPLIRLSDTEWLAAAHAMEIADVFVDDELTESWESVLVGDDLGNMTQRVRFSAPIANSSTVSATGRGRRNPETGELIENPADVMEFVARLAGMDYTFPTLRAQAAAEGIRIAGSLDASRTTRAWLDEIAFSAGAIWTQDDAVLYPVPDGASGGPIFDLSAAVVGGLSDPVADLEDTADVVRIGYRRASATGRMQGHVELTARPQLYGGAVLEVELPWVQIPANAEAIGRRLLARLSGRRYVVSFTLDRHDLRPGRRVRLVDNPGWPIPGEDPVVMLLAVDVAANAGATYATGETVVSTPTIEVTAHSVALPDTTEGGVDVEFRNGIVTFTVRDEDKRPLAGARVTLDGSTPRRTDASGRVSFSTVAGVHELLIELPGYATQRVEIELE